MKFPLNAGNLASVEEEEALAVRQIKEAIINNPDDIAAVIIEPIQGEGGDNHFRGEFLTQLRVLCDENEILLIFDEVQTGVGITGKMWASEYFVMPDMITFGKKTQVCGFMCTGRIDDVLENVFHKSSRINSTFGGNLIDMVRCTRILEIIEEESLVENARLVGAHLLKTLNLLEDEFPKLVDNSRGRGLFCAMDLATSQERDQLKTKAYEEGLILIGCGDRSIRFRPPLNMTKTEIDDGMSIIIKALREISVGE